MLVKDVAGVNELRESRGSFPYLTNPNGFPALASFFFMQMWELNNFVNDDECLIKATDQKGVDTAIFLKCVQYTLHSKYNLNWYWLKKYETFFLFFLYIAHDLQAGIKVFLMHN